MSLSKNGCFNGEIIFFAANLHMHAWYDTHMATYKCLQSVGENWEKNEIALNSYIIYIELHETVKIQCFWKSIKVVNLYQSYGHRQ